MRFTTGHLGLWTLITEKNPREYDEKDYEKFKDLRKQCALLEVVILDLTDRRNRKQFSIQFGKILSMKELHPANYEADDDEEEYFSASGDGLGHMYLQKTHTMSTVSWYTR